MSEKTIRVGIVGAGANTRLRHIPCLRAQPGVELVAVASRSPESSTRAAEEHGSSRAADHWRDIVADKAIDAVCIGTWPYMHAPITIAALEAGKHVLCEARMAMNASEAHAMLRAARAQPAQVAQIVPAPHTLPSTEPSSISSGTAPSAISSRSTPRSPTAATSLSGIRPRTGATTGIFPAPTS